MFYKTHGTQPEKVYQAGEWCVLKTKSGRYYPAHDSPSAYTLLYYGASGETPISYAPNRYGLYRAKRHVDSLPQKSGRGGE